MISIVGCNNNSMFWKKKKSQDINPLDTRWTFKNELNDSEKEVYEKASAQIDMWWNEFEKNQTKIIDAFKQRSNFDVGKFMNDNLKSIHKHLFWEFGPAVECDGYRLVITTESYKHLRPLVKEIMTRAPKINNWEFYSHRLPEGYELAIETVKARTGGQIEDLAFQLDINEFNLVDLYFTRESCLTEQDFNQAFNDAFVAIETILGEENLDKWVGAIEVDNKPKDSLESMQIKDLMDSFSKKLHEIKYHLPQEYHYEISNNSNWIGLELKPEKKDDYLYQSDLFVARTMNEAMWKTAHSGQLFYSERFTSKEEIFCYIKLDGSQGLDEEKFADKAEIEDALDSLLVKEKIGSVIGGGTGLKYSYIDLALVDLDKGISIIKEVLRNANISKNTWILFFDSELESEWIGIWDETPKPPLADFKNRD